MKLESWHSSRYKSRWKIVDRKDGSDVHLDCLIHSADEETGVVRFVSIGTLRFGLDGIKIVRKTL